MALIVQQAHELGCDGPIVGSDSWGSAELMNLCGDECKGLFFSTHYAAEGATGATKEFIDRYNAKYGYVPDDVGALTWDTMLIVQKAIQDCGTITGDLATDRECVRDALAQIKDFDGITGKMTFTEEGDPIKCAVIVRISDAGHLRVLQAGLPVASFAARCASVVLRQAAGGRCSVSTTRRWGRGLDPPPQQRGAYSMQFFLQNVVNALQWGSFYALIALGYSMVYGVLMLFNFAHGDIFMVGAYIGFFVATALLGIVALGVIPLPEPVLLALVLVLTIIITMILNSLVGMVVERIGYRPLRERTARLRRHHRPDDRHHPGDRQPGDPGRHPFELP